MRRSTVDPIEPRKRRAGAAATFRLHVHMILQGALLYTPLIFLPPRPLRITPFVLLTHCRNLCSEAFFAAFVLVRDRRSA
jgi:hypothetical protein